MDSLHPNQDEGKVCRECGFWKPRVKFDVARTCKDGRRATCRECQRPAEPRKAYMVEWRAQNVEHRREYKRNYYHNNPDKMKAHAARVYQRHGDKIRARSRQWALNNHEWYKKRLRQYAAEHTEETRTRTRERTERLKAELGEAYYEQQRERARIYRETHPEELRATQANAHARRKRQAEGTWTAAEFKAVCDHYGNVCLRCGAAKKLHADHVVPLVKGGRNDITNLQPLCHSCNSRKHVDDTDYRPDGGAFAHSLKAGD